MEKLTIPNQTLPHHTNTGIEPKIIVQGSWLPEYGFKVDSKLQMEIEQDKITITTKDNGNTRAKK